MRRKTSKGLLAAGVVLGTLGVLVEPAAAAIVIQHPTVVFGPKALDTTASIPVPFNLNPDPISLESRIITIDTQGADDECPASFTYDGNPEGGCTEVQLGVNTGTIAVTVSGDATSNQTPGGAEVLQDGGSGGQLNLVGSDEQVTAALLTLVYTPPTVNPNDATDPFETFDTAGGRVFLTLDPQDGNDVDGDTVEIEIRIEGLNDPPTLEVGPLPLPTAPPYAVTPDGIPGSTELEINDLVVLEDIDLEQGELDDIFLVVAWVTEGRFTLRGDSGACVGAPDQVLTVGFCADDDWDELLALLGPVGDLVPGEVLGELNDLAPDLATPSQAVVFLAEHDPAVNVLTRFEYYADENDCDCSFNVFATDLGNNGMPLPGVLPAVMPSIPVVLSIPIEVRNLVNDAPTVDPSIASPVAIEELATSAPFGFTVEDVDAACDITLDGVTATGGVLTGAPSTPVSGSPETISGLLAALTFTASETADPGPGLGSVVVDVEDNGCGDAPGDPSLTGQGIVTFTIADDGEIDTDPDPDLNDAPVVTVPASPVATTEGTLTEFVDGDIGVTDPDAGPAGELTMTVTLTGDGQLARGVDLFPDTFSETGTSAELNATLDFLRFTPTDDADGADTTATIEIEVDDNGNTGAGGALADTDSFTIEVADPDPDPPGNQPPSITADVVDDTITEGQPGLLSFDIIDADDTEATLVDLVSTCGTVTGAPLEGTTEALADLLDGLSITAPDAPTCSVTATISDGEFEDADTATFIITQLPDPPENEPPVVTAVVVDDTIDEGQTGQFSFTIVDPDDTEASLVSLLTTCGPVTGLPDLDTPEALATLLDGLTITAPDAPNCSVTATVSDGELEDAATATFTITQLPDPDPNQPPTIDGPGPLEVVTGGVIAFTGANAITIADDADPGSQLTLQVSEVGDGGVSAAAVPGDTTGTLAELQAVLDDLVFTAGAPGAASVTITLLDNGNTGTGGPQTASLTIPIAVTAQATTSTTATTAPGGGGSPTTPAGGGATTTTAAVGAGGAGRGGSTLPRTGADLLVLAGFALVLAGVGGLLSGRRARATA